MRLDSHPAAFVFLLKGGMSLMISALHSNSFTCEICGRCAVNPTTIGIESDSDITLEILLCHSCGPLDLELMHLCREITVGCTVN
jgi:hypothetical protein